MHANMCVSGVEREEDQTAAAYLWVSNHSK